jgi:transcriptional regulator with XRE-family HTH domain
MTGRPISTQFGLVVRSLRVRSGLSQESLAERAGLHPSYVSMVERGTRNATLDVADRIAGALQISLKDLIGACESNSDLDPRP